MSGGLTPSMEDGKPFASGDTCIVFLIETDKEFQKCSEKFKEGVYRRLVHEIENGETNFLNYLKSRIRKYEIGLEAWKREDSTRKNIEHGSVGEGN